MNKISQDQIGRMVNQTLPPDVKILPRIFDFNEDGSGLRYLFAEELEFAVELLYKDGDTRLLDALRRKWPEAVDAGWSVASEEALREIELFGYELSAEGAAAMADLSVEHKPTRMIAAMA